MTRLVGALGRCAARFRRGELAPPIADFCRKSLPQKRSDEVGTATPAEIRPISARNVPTVPTLSPPLTGRWGRVFLPTFRGLALPCPHRPHLFQINGWNRKRGAMRRNKVCEVGLGVGTVGTLEEVGTAQIAGAETPANTPADLREAQLANAEEDRLDALEEAECAVEDRDGYRHELARVRAQLRDLEAKLRAEKHEHAETRSRLARTRDVLTIAAKCACRWAARRAPGGTPAPTAIPTTAYDLNSTAAQLSHFRGHR